MYFENFCAAPRPAHGFAPDVRKRAVAPLTSFAHDITSSRFAPRAGRSRRPLVRGPRQQAVKGGRESLRGCRSIGSNARGADAYAFGRFARRTCRYATAIESVTKADKCTATNAAKVIDKGKSADNSRGAYRSNRGTIRFNAVRMIAALRHPVRGAVVQMNSPAALLFVGHRRIDDDARHTGGCPVVLDQFFVEPHLRVTGGAGVAADEH